ncbi:uncharacterized protein A4U43_C03F3260 [Asparagus officinalis]|uniref:RRM domain-containing protein n=1 Tax=Asparagus officinalis TaxID=4686 RepID=A0A5P1F709_ASPOF|nr:28 kDa ribonucleoprotein, chloroplastic-like [Asparagus officinalis]XP_020255806.1 28 kDa ribonucleoprotein, chloroplastic-like [Asparagus officinalis]XP_020255807.1 28 kDa ribonucleoprotein, chloroplastic-like [Asparagus officinalis]XP_020255808.1 28 kDa ribonucleoprotein, chloroplastic-like [Asparagus officinalis]ONK74148.1 uncharacterized protein A4U43_C03F3260 [Asparagus officinalis]
MALQFLNLPSIPHPLSSLRFSKPNPSSELSPPLLISPPTCLKCCTRLNPRFNSFVPRTSSSISAQTTEGGGGVRGPAVEIYDRKRLIAQNIPWTCTAEDIRALFGKHGDVLDVELSMYNKTRNRGLAFITMASEEEANVALTNLNSYDMDGRNIKIEYARPKKNPRAEVEAPTKKYTVYVGNLAYRVSSQDLRELFDTGGKVISAEVIYQSKPRRPAGYGFVSFASIDEANNAISDLNGKGFMGRPLRLGLSKLQTEDIEKIIDEDLGGSSKASNEMNTNEELSN